jgi:hypothetical protein
VQIANTKPIIITHFRNAITIMESDLSQQHQHQHQPSTHRYVSFRDPKYAAEKATRTATTTNNNNLDTSDLDVEAGVSQNAQHINLLPSVEQPGKDPRANESGSKGCRKIARGASARAARRIHPIPAKQYDGVAPSTSPTRTDSSLEHADRGSVLKGRTRERMSYAESARGKLPFQLP